MKKYTIRGITKEYARTLSKMEEYAKVKSVWFSLSDEDFDIVNNAISDCLFSREVYQTSIDFLNAFISLYGLNISLETFIEITDAITDFDF